MRYFRYKNTNKNFNSALKVQYKTFMEKSRLIRSAPNEKRDLLKSLQPFAGVLWVAGAVYCDQVL